MPISQARIATPLASRYLQQLCKHFAHKLPVEFDPQRGRIEFSIGLCRLEASPELAEEIIDRARLLALPARVVGRVGGNDLVIKGEAPLPLAELRETHESWLPAYMSG